MELPWPEEDVCSLSTSEEPCLPISHGTRRPFRQLDAPLVCLTGGVWGRGIILGALRCLQPWQRAEPTEEGSAGGTGEGAGPGARRRLGLPRSPGDRLEPSRGAVPGEQPDGRGVTLLQEGLVTWESSRAGLTAAWAVELSAQGLCQVSHPGISAVVLWSKKASAARCL